VAVPSAPPAARPSADDVPRKSWPARHKVWTGAGVVLLLGFTGSALGSTHDPATPGGHDGPASVSTAAIAPTPTAPAATAAATHSVTSPVTTEVAAPAAPKAGTALALLAQLRVKGRSAKTGYDRAAFGPAWTDTNRNGCDTRNDILRRDLTARTVKAGTNGCKILAGTLSVDPYTRQAIQFVYGGASEIDIDHVVALGDAWQKGGSGWVFRKRLAFANDPMNLLAVDASANRQKGDGDAATWLPANKSYRCAYVARQVAVKAKYQLWVTSAERTSIARVLGGCPGQAAPSGTAPTISPVAGIAPPSSKAPTAVSPAPVSGASARCRDGSLSYSAHRRGTCSDHGGVAAWLKDLPS
jgi:hypothetical protein